MAEKKRLILAVDDDERVLRLLQIQLTSLGYPVVTATSGKQALELIDLDPPSLVFLDMMMPEMDGLQTLRAVKRKNADIPVVILTGLYDNEEATKAVQAGAHDYLTKPVDLDYLKNILLSRLFS